MTMNQNKAYASTGGITGVLNVAYGVIKQKMPVEPEYAEVSEIPRNKKKEPNIQFIASRLQ